MKRRTVVLRGMFSLAALGGIVACAVSGYAQGNGYERTFPQSKATIEKMLKEIPTAGRLPVLDGFAIASAPDRPLERYRRGYYQLKLQVVPGPSGGSVVRVIVEVTAWYADPIAAKSGYQLLTSNGRLEADMLDQLADQLAAGAPGRVRILRRPHRQGPRRTLPPHGHRRHRQQCPLRQPPEPLRHLLLRQHLLRQQRNRQHRNRRFQPRCRGFRR